MPAGLDVDRRARHVTWLLCVDQVCRASSFEVQPPATRLLAELAGWQPAVLVVSTVMIVAGLLGFGRRAALWAGYVGHTLGFFSAVMYAFTVAWGAVDLGLSWSTSAVYVLVAVLHFRRLTLAVDETKRPRDDKAAR